MPLIARSPWVLARKSAHDPAPHRIVKECAHRLGPLVLISERTMTSTLSAQTEGLSNVSLIASIWLCCRAT